MCPPCSQPHGAKAGLDPGARPAGLPQGSLAQQSLLGMSAPGVISYSAQADSSPSPRGAGLGHRGPGSSKLGGGGRGQTKGALGPGRGAEVGESQRTHGGSEKPHGRRSLLSSVAGGSRGRVPPRVVCGWLANEGRERHLLRGSGQTANQRTRPPGGQGAPAGPQPR